MPVEDHSRLAPSSSDRWSNCPGSARHDLPDTGSEAAYLGTLAHSMAEFILGGGKKLSPKLAKEWGAIDPEIRKELQECIDLYVDFVRGLSPDQMLHEVKLHHPEIADFGGTADTIALTKDEIHIVDLKSGQYPVGVVGNSQLKSYLLLASREFPGRSRFYATIIQTRVGDGLPKTTSFTQAELDEWELVVASAACKDHFHAGAWCEWCPLLVNCETAYNHAREMAQEEFDELTVTDRELEIIRFSDVIAKMVKRAKEKIFQILKDGGSVPGWKLARSLGNRVWSDEKQFFATVTKHGFKKRDLQVTTALSPAQVEKLPLPSGMKRGQLKELVGTLTERPDRGLVAAPITSKLGEVNLEDSFDEIPVEGT